MSATQRQYLTMMDRMEIVLDEIMREQGISGYETQVLVWLRTCVDVAVVRAAAARLGRLYPVVTARLVKKGRRYNPYWQLPDAGTCSLTEHHLTSSDPESVLALASQLLSTPRDLAADDPMTLHLVHRAGGGDVFLVQLNHVLGDFKVIKPLLWEVDRLSRGEPDAAETAPAGDAEILTSKLRQIPLTRRITSVCQFLDLSFRQFHRPAAVLGNGRLPEQRPATIRCASRSLAPEQVRTVEARTAETFGFSSLSMVLLACAYRAMAARRRSAGAQDYRCSTIVGLDLGVRPTSRPVFTNLVASVTLHADSSELGDRDALTRILSERLRERVRRGEDWAIVDLGLLAMPYPRLLAKATRKVLAEENSFGFAYFGALDDVGPRFCGADVEDLSITATSAPPAGMTLLSHKLGGRLSLQAVYLPELVPDLEVEEFLDTLLTDFVR